MGKKTISNTFTVNTIIDGESAPYYFQEWFAWSNVVSTASATTSPFESQEPYSGWSASIPNQGSDAYLWKKIVTYTWNDSTRTYIAGIPQYFRMSGTNGTSISVKGSVDYAYNNTRDFPPASSSLSGKTAVAKTQGNKYRCVFLRTDYYWIYDAVADGDSYTVVQGSFEEDSDYQSASQPLSNHLIQWSNEGQQWLDLGQFKGESGVTYYTHVVWAQSVTIVNGAITGMTGYTPVKPSGDSSYIWMGVHVDTNSADPTNKEDTYSWEWTNTKGEKGDTGDSAAIAHANHESISVPCNVDGSVSSQIQVSMSFSMKVGTGSATNIRVNSPTSYPTGVSYSASQQSTGTITISTSATASGMAGGLTFTVIGYYDGKDYTATITIALIGAVKGSTGSRGKIGRFFYFGGTFNAADTTQTFIVNDAQAPYFEHSETVTTQSGTTTIKRYHVFNYETNGSYTMAQMWAISSNWNNKPWEVMTNDFKYIITEALFAQFAQFGSAIISGDWMISQHGTINGVESQNYTSFDPDHPNDNTGTNFIPNYALDMRTGATIQNSTITRFRDIDNDYTWYASGSYIVAGWSYMIGISSNIVTNAEAKLNVPEHAGANQSIILPVDVSNVGRTITIFENSTLPLSRLRCVYVYLEERLRYGTGQFFGLCKCNITDVSKYWVSYRLCFKCGCIELVGVPIVANGQAACGWLVKSKMCGLLYDQNNHVYEGLTT